MTASAARADSEITISTTTEVDVVPLGGGILSTSTRWHATIGDSSQTALDPDEFFRVVERDDLARRYERRRTIGAVGTAIGLSGIILGGFLMARDSQDDYMKAGAIAAGGGFVSLMVGAYFFHTANSTSEEDARYLADVHNATVRERRRMSLTPLPGGAGITASGSF